MHLGREDLRGLVGERARQGTTDDRTHRTLGPEALATQGQATLGEVNFFSQGNSWELGAGGQMDREESLYW